MNRDASFTEFPCAATFDPRSRWSAHFLGCGLTNVARAILKKPQGEPGAVEQVLTVFNQLETTGKSPTNDDGRSFVAAVQSAYRMESTLRVNEKGLLILTLQCYLENEVSPFFEWIIRFEQHARIQGSTTTEHALTAR